MKKLIVGAVAVALLTGCYKHPISLDGNPQPERSPDTVRWHHHFLGGLINASKPLPLDTMCPNGAAFVKTKIAWYQPLIGGITEGIYTPSKDLVWCKQGAATTIQADTRDVVAAVDLVEQDAAGAALETLAP